jgi:protein-disulfide isomerase
MGTDITVFEELLCKVLNEQRMALLALIAALNIGNITDIQSIIDAIAQKNELLAEILDVEVTPFETISTDVKLISKLQDLYSLVDPRSE